MDFIHNRSKSESSVKNIDYSKIPEHVAIVMDGNGRWAQRRGLPRSAGHRAGAQTLKKIVEFANKIGIKYLTVFAFSTENWSRPAEEVNALMNLLSEFLRDNKKVAIEKNIKLNVIGDITALPSHIQSEIMEAEQLTHNKTGLVLNIALNYGGKSEIVEACRKLCKLVMNGKLTPEQINEKTFASCLYTADMPDPDLIIRPSGELRISNFLLWQSAYSEFWYSDILWPDFTEKDLLQAIVDFQGRNRRYGGI